MKTFLMLKPIEANKIEQTLEIIVKYHSIMKLSGEDKEKVEDLHTTIMTLGGILEDHKAVYEAFTKSNY